MYDRVLSAKQIQLLYQKQYNLIVSQELKSGDSWQGAVTPNDGIADGTTVFSNLLNVTSSSPVASFTANRTSGIAPLAIQFNDTSTNTPTSWNWSFGDTTWFNTTVAAERNATHIYTIPNSYTARLTVANAGGSSTTEPGISITVNPAGIPAPVANFTAAPLFGTAPLPISFTDLSSNSPTGWAWFFGDENYTQAWTQQTASAGWSARQVHSSVALPDGSIVLIGGWISGSFTNDTWRSTDNGATWTNITGNPGWSARGAHTTVAMPDGSIVLMGGSGIIDSDVWRSTDKGATWTLMNASAGWSARFQHSSVVLADGSIVLTGGNAHGGVAMNDTWRSMDNGATWTLMNASAGWSARFEHSSVGMPDGSIVLMGGYDNTHGPENDTWRSTDKGATWTRVNASSGWSARNRHNSVALPDGSIVLMGGYSSGFKNDTWRSMDNGATWTQLPNAGWSVREAYSSVAMANGSIILTGGYDGSSLKKDVWRFNPVGSSAQSPSHTYTASGNYNVTLQAYNAGGYNNTRKIGYITVNSLPPVHNLNSGKNFTTIQAAINDAATLTGHTILVDSGIYHERVTVGKSITLRGNDTGTGYPIVDADNLGSAFWITQNGTILENFKAINGSSSLGGIYVYSSHNILTHLNVSGNRNRGIELQNSENNTIAHVWGTNNLQSIVHLYHSNGNRILNISSNWSDSGITLWSNSNHNLIENLTINNGTAWPGIWISTSNNNIINNNSVSYYQQGIRLEYTSEYNIVTNNILRNNSEGIQFNGVSSAWINHSVISGNTINNNTYGVRYSGIGNTNNTLKGNLIKDNTMNGVDLFGSSFNISGNTISGNGNRGINVDASNNLIFDNYFNNTQNVEVSGAQINTWNTAKTSGTNIIGGSNLGGNYWANPSGTGFSQTCTNAGDGICTAAYTIATNNIDNFPLTNNFAPVIPAPVANFTATPRNGTAPLPVSFTDLSLNSTGRAWFFGDENFTAPWTEMNASSGWTGRYDHSSVAMPDGSIVLMGGYDGTYKNDVWRSTDNGSTWTLANSSAGWTGRYDHSSVVLPDGSIVLMGGIGSGYIRKNDVWRSTDKGATWT